MDVFTPLSRFYEAIADDARISSTHISVYIALLRAWSTGGGKNPVKIERTMIMKAAKISARHTYNKRMNELHDFGYIIYEPTCNQYDASLIDIRQAE